MNSRSANKRKFLGRSLAMLVGLTLVGIVTWATILWMEPSYEGKRVSHWVNVISQNPSNSREAREALGALQSIGEPAVPYVAKLLSRKNSPNYDRIFTKLPSFLRQFFPDPQPEISLPLAYLSSLGTNAHQAGPTLAALLLRSHNKKTEVLRVPVKTLKNLTGSQPRIPAHWKPVTNGQFVIYYSQDPPSYYDQGLSTLMTIAPGLDATTDLLSHEIKKSTFISRTEFFQKLQQWQMPVTRKTIELMKYIMDHHTESYVAVVCQKLIVSAAPMPGESDWLKADLSSTNKTHRLIAALRLVGEKEFTEKSLDVFEYFLLVKGGFSGTGASLKLQQMESPPERGLQILLRTLEVNPQLGPSLREFLCSNKFQGRFDHAVGKCLIKNRIPTERQWAVYLFRKTGAAAIPDLIAALEDKNESVILGACEALRLQGWAAKEAAPALKTLVNHRSLAVQKAAQKTLEAVQN